MLAAPLIASFTVASFVMESQRTSVDNTPLVVNFLRLIRNARSPHYEDHEHGPSTFHFGGLRMNDSGPYTEAEAAWHEAMDAGRRRDGDDYVFSGPLHLAVRLNDIVVEVWTLRDYREVHTEHSVPTNFEQLEHLNTLVRVVFAHLRMQDIYAVVVQSCTNGAGFDDRSRDAGLSTTFSSMSSPTIPVNAGSRTDATASSARVILQLYTTEADCPEIPAQHRRAQLWSTEDFIRIDVATNTSWSTQWTAVAAQRRSSPIRTTSPALHGRVAVEGGDSGGSASPEIGGSLGKSLPTPYLAPRTPAPASAGRVSSSMAGGRLSPLLPRRTSPLQAMTELMLPPADIQQPQSLESDSSWVQHPSPLTAKSQPVYTVATPSHAEAGDELREAMQLSVADHVRRMALLLAPCLEGEADFLHKPTAANTKGAIATGQPHQLQRESSLVGSMVPSTSVGALSTMELDGHLWSENELDALGLDLHGLGVSGDGNPLRKDEELITLLSMCRTAKLRDVARAPFGDLVISLNITDSSTAL